MIVEYTFSISTSRSLSEKIILYASDPSSNNSRIISISVEQKTAIKPAKVETVC